MSDKTPPASDANPSAPAAGRSTPAPPPAAKKKGASKGAKVAGGVAAAAAAVAAGLAYGDEIVEAASPDADPDASPGAFDAAGPVGTPLVEAVPTGGGGGGARSGAQSEAPPRQARRAESEAADAPSAPRPAAQAAQVAPPSVDAEFEAARATLLARLDNFEAPAGTSPEDAAQLRQELIDTVSSFTPSPGQTTEQALAALRNEYDDQVEDFTQDQKIDALVEEAQRDNAAEAGADDEVDDATVDAEVDAEVDPAEVDPAEVDPAEVDPAEIDLADIDPQDLVAGVRDDSVRPTDLTRGDVASNSFVLTGDLSETAEVAPTVQRFSRAAEPGVAEIVRDRPAHELRDDFEMMIAEPQRAEALGSSPLPDSGLPVSPSEQPAPTDDNAVGFVPAALIDSHDVLGFVPAASTVDASEPLEMAAGFGAPIVGDTAGAFAQQQVGQQLGQQQVGQQLAQQQIAQQLEQNQVIEFVDLGVEPIAEIEIEPVPTPVDDLMTEGVNFADSLASDVTPARPDTTSFEP